MLLIVAGNVHQCDVSGKRAHAILEIDQIEDKVGEQGQLGVVLTLLNHDVVFIVNLVLGVVLEDLGESDLIAVAQVVHVLEELLLLSIGFVVITVLSKRLLDHVFTEDTGVLDSAWLEACWVKHELSNGCLLHVLLIEGEEISLKSGIAVLGTLDETLEHTALSTLVSGLVIVAVTVLVLEDLGINHILKGFMRLVLQTGLNEIVLLELEFALGSDSTLVELLSDNVVFGVTLKIGLEVIAVHLLLFCEPSEEVGVVLSPSLALSLKHALLSAFVVFGVRKLSSSELLNLIEGAVEAANSLFNVVPSFIKILAIGGWEVNSVLSELTVNLSEGLVHGVELLMSFLQSL